MKCRLVGAGLLLAFTMCREATAEEASGKSTTALPGGTEETESLTPPRRWYGWQIIMADVTSTVALVTLVNKAEGYAFLPYVVLAPGVHVANGQPLNGLASVGIRFGVPIVGILIGAAVESGCSALETCLAGPAYGMLFGMLGAMVIDASLLAYDERPHVRHKALPLTPTLAVDRRGARIGLVGAF
jgi:hypothetical protein